ncbi:Rossmann-like and DUF2520 domain-containing protein [Spongisporangium articulatum]|uniref:Rossmann-like and DUF2520 domain-containing protein n=1 Tax=Spongisporangium articulatum TaxID=3362603 RepID=A0ABW8AQK7_9ACTN
MDNPSKRPGRLGVGVIGAGKVGAVLGSALRAAGHAVVGVSAVSARSLDRAEVMLPGVPVLEVPVVVERAELVLLAVPDDALPGLVEGLAETNTWQPGQLVVHTSGRYGWRVLEPAVAQGAIPLALHPAMTFTGTSLDLTRLTGACFGVTAPAAVLPIAQALVVEMGSEPFVIDEEQRGLYHAALAHGANHLVTLVAQATQLLGQAGVENPARLIGPLLDAALDNALERGEQALTGPVARGDAGTVRAHLEAIRRASGPDQDIVATYRALARATADRALAGGRLRPEQAESLLDALMGPSDLRDADERPPGE